MLTRDERGALLGGVPLARISEVYAAESATYVERHPRSRARAAAGMAGWYDGVPIRIVLRPRSETDTALLGELFPGLAAAMTASCAPSTMP